MITITNITIEHQPLTKLVGIKKVQELDQKTKGTISQFLILVRNPSVLEMNIFISGGQTIKMFDFELA